MNNKKLSRLLEPNLKLYFLCMALFCLLALAVNPLLALAEACVTAALYAYFSQVNKKRRQGILQYIDSVTGSVDTASKSTLIHSPPAHHGLPAGHRGGHLEQRGLSPAGRGAGAPL